VILKGEVLEICNVDGSLHVARRLGITTNGTRRFPRTILMDPASRSWTTMTLAATRTWCDAPHPHLGTANGIVPLAAQARHSSPDHKRDRALGDDREHHVGAQKRGRRQNPSHIIALGDPKVILKGEVLEVRNVDGSIQIGRKTKKHDDWNPAIPDYDPCAPPPPQPTKVIEA
jgi:hypothetical protein